MKIDRDADGRYTIRDANQRVVLTAADATCEVDGKMIRLSTLEGGATDEGRTLTVEGATGTGVRLLWSVHAEPDAGVRLTLEVQNNSTGPIIVSRLTPLDAHPVGVDPDEDLRVLNTGAGSWGAKSLDRLEDDAEAGLVSAIAGASQAGAVCGFVGVGRHRGFVRWTRLGASMPGGEAVGSPRVRLEALHYVTGDRSARSALVGSAGALARDGDAAEPLSGAPGVLGPGERIVSESAFFQPGDVFVALERWADLTGRENGAVIMNPPAAGFYTWYYYREHVNEEVILSNARYLAEHRDRLPVNYVHLDWGWQENYSCGHREVGPGFPHGLAWLTRQVRDLGFIPGLWYTPFMHDHPSSPLPVERPELFQAGADGEPSGFGEPIRNIMADMVPGMDTRRDGTMYRIDPSAPGARDYLLERYRWAVEQGFGMVMLDFVLNGVPAPGIVPRDGSKTWETAMREGLAAVREAVGDQTMIMGCGAPYEPMIGHGNFVRVAVDVPAHWKAVKRGSLPLLWQYFMHNRLWTNYADAVSVRATPSPFWPLDDDGSPLSLTLDEARLYVTVTGLSGAAVMIAEDLTALPPEREALLSLILPICDEGEFRPVDLFRTDAPRLLRRVFSRTAEREEGWAVVAVVNWDDGTDERGATIGELLAGAPVPHAGEAGARFHVWDAFAGKPLGALDAGAGLAPVAPHGVVLARVTPVGDRPQIVGTTTHINQGALELSAVQWEPDTAELSVALGDLFGRRGELVLSIPAGMALRGLSSGERRTAVNGDAAWRELRSDEEFSYVAVPVTLDGSRLVLEFERA